MGQKLVITLDEATTARYLERAQAQITADVNAECIPSDVVLLIEMGGPFGTGVSIRCGNQYEEIGDAEADLIETA